MKNQPKNGFKASTKAFLHFWQFFGIFDDFLKWSNGACLKYNLFLSFFSNDDESEAEPKLAWNLEVLHNVMISQEASKWQRIFQRGISMRSNMCQGNFQLWRFFLTDAERVPLNMNKNTTNRELRYKNIKYKSI